MSTPWTYFVGDIHGCYEELRELEDKIAAHAARNGVDPLVVSVGDLVDRGPQSREVVAHFRRGAEAGTHAAILGNHEFELLENLYEHHPEHFEDAGVGLPAFMVPIAERHGSMPRFLALDQYRVLRLGMWVGQGGAECLQSYGCEPHDPATWRIDPEDLRFLATLPMFWQSERFVTTHAIATADDLDLARRFAVDDGPFDSYDIRRVFRDMVWRRALPTAPADPVRVHVSGHTPKGRPVRLKKARAIQVDTGCVLGGRLTAWCGEADRILSVACV